MEGDRVHQVSIPGVHRLLDQEPQARGISEARGQAVLNFDPGFEDILFLSALTSKVKNKITKNIENSCFFNFSFGSRVDFINCFAPYAELLRQSKASQKLGVEHK